MIDNHPFDEDIPFEIPDNFTEINDIFSKSPLISDLQDEAKKLQTWKKELSIKLEEIKKRFSLVEALLIEEIEKTGADKWQKGKKWAKVNKKVTFNFVKEYRTSVLEWVSDYGADNRITVPWSSLQGFINDIYKGTEEDIEDLIERLPEFIKVKREKSISLSKY